MPLKNKYPKYDPFIKNDFILPERWCIKFTKENQEILYKWKISKGYNAKPTEWSALNYHGYGIPESQISDYTEITFDQFKKYVLKENNEVTKEEVIEKVIPEYLECIKPQFWANTIKDNNGNLIFDTKNFKFSYYSNTWEHAVGNYSNFKPSTKEAFDAQNQPKSIEKWSVGTYVLFLKDLNHVKAGYIDIINESLDKGGCIYLEKYLSMAIPREKDGEVKWFATKSEAEEFYKTLVEPVKCGNGILDRIEPKQQLKQAVHCKSQEEWYFVISKISKKDSAISKLLFNNKRGCININGISRAPLEFYLQENYQILSFQEWCDLNSYKMEKEVKFEVGKWYKNLGVSNRSSNFGKFLSIRNGCEFWMSECIYQESKVDIEEQWLNYSDQTVECSIEEIQQYLPDNHVDKITPVIQQTRDMQSKFKVGEYVICCGNIYEYSKPQICRLTSVGESITDCRGKFKFSRNNNKESGSVWLKNYVRHATPEEINNHLISIGQIPAGEPLNNGIEPNKDGMFKYTTVTGNAVIGKCSSTISRTTTISKPSEELFNYLPEPK